MSYTAPLRSAVLWLLEQPYRWNAESVASLTGLSPSRARAYLTKLAEDGVLRDDGSGCYTHSWCYIAWKERTPETEPGGNARAYQDARRERLETYFEQHQARIRLGRQLKELRGQLPASHVADRAHITRQVLNRIERGLVRVRITTLERIVHAIEELKHERQAH